MSSEEKFKDLLKEKLENKEFPFNPSNWEKAQEMIDAARTKNRSLLPFIFLCIGFFISGGLFFYFLDSTILQPKSRLPNDTSLQPALPKTQPATSELQQPLIENDKKPAVVEKNGKNETAKPAEKAVAHIEKNIPTVNRNTPKNNNHPSQNIVAPSKNIKKYEQIKETPKVVETQAMMTNVTMSKRIPKASLPVTDLKEEQENQAKNTAIVSAVPEQPAKEVEQNSKIEEPVKQTEPLNNPIPENNVPVAVNEKQVEKQPEIKLEETETKSEPEKNSPVPAEEKTDVATVAVPKDADKNTQEPAGNDSTPQKKNHEPKNIFSVEGGLNYHLGWKNDGNKDANSINPMIGVNYLRTFGSKLNLSLGLHYTTVGNLSNYSHTSKDTRYGFGETSDLTVITPVKIHYLLVPLKLHYVLDQKNMIGIGYTFGYLLTVNNTVENYSQRLNSTSDYKTSKTKGYSEGFNPFDSQVSLFYRRKLFNDLSANTEFFYGLTDIKDNSFFASNYFERNMGIKFTLIYNLFKK